MKKETFINRLRTGIEQFAAKNANTLEGKDIIFFRGQPSKCQLLPSLLRTCHPDQTRRIENRLFCDTFIICPEYLDFSSSWEVLAMMQHYGIPTRLLDWTSSLSNALFFATEKCQKCHKVKCRKCKDKPALWLLAPHRMHESFYHNTPLEERVSITIGVDNFVEYRNCFLENNTIDNAATKKNVIPWTWNNPIFMDIPWRNPRIKSQKGYFTFHTMKKALEEFDESSKFVLKIEMSHNDIKEVKNLLELMSITDFDIYSDLSALSHYLKFKYHLEEEKKEKKNK